MSPDEDRSAKESKRCDISNKDAGNGPHVNYVNNESNIYKIHDSRRNMAGKYSKLSLTFVSIFVGCRSRRRGRWQCLFIYFMARSRRVTREGEGFLLSFDMSFPNENILFSHGPSEMKKKTTSIYVNNLSDHSNSTDGIS